MTLYLDTSLLVAALTNEAGTFGIQAWLADQMTERLAISDWVTTEFSSTLSIKLRTGQLQVSHRAEALSMFTRLAANSFDLLPIAGRHFRIAARFVDQHAHGLRAGDALHVAVCAEQGVTLCTLDKRLGEAGPALGVKTLLL